ncbi:hypothetical protein B0H14DRAFT_3873671 [Mycena olivaceomarginata]|nr:hypothetical protein B0H14DRAFT_3873671 [Mycena olivaceomarginata]
MAGARTRERELIPLQANISERCPGDQSIHCASLVSIFRALETEPIKNEALLRCISAHLDERAHAGQAVCPDVPAAADDACSRTTKAAKRGTQRPRAITCSSRQRARASQKRRVEVPAAEAVLAPMPAALVVAMYSTRKMAILTQAAAILTLIHDHARMGRSPRGALQGAVSRAPKSQTHHACAAPTAYPGRVLCFVLCDRTRQCSMSTASRATRGDLSSVRKIQPESNLIPCRLAVTKYKSLLQILHSHCTITTLSYSARAH